MNKKGSTYSLILFVTAIGIFIWAYFHMAGSFKALDAFDDKLHIGEQQAKLLDTVQEGESALLYIEQAAKYAFQAGYDSFDSSGRVFREVIEGDDTALSETECGSFVYNKWSTLEKFCPPRTPITNFKGYFTLEMNDFLSNSPYPVPNNNYEFVLKEENGVTYVEGIPLEPLRMDIGTVRAKEVAVFGGEFSWPVADTVLTSCYGNRYIGKSDFHDGLDFGIGGQQVKTIESGTIHKVCNNQPCNVKESNCRVRMCNGYGNNVVVKHSDNLYTRYSHMRYGSVNIREGSSVNKGDVLGIVGNTGFSGGDHLDLKVYTSSDLGPDKAKNPMCFFTDEQLARLKTGPNANSCKNHFGRPVPVYRKEMLGSQCEGIEFEKINSEVGEDTEYEKRKVGTYEIMPRFKIRTDRIKPGADVAFDEVVDWAEETWEECVENPLGCLRDKIEEFNAEGLNYTISETCEGNEFYNKLIETFEVCLANGQYGCTCEQALQDLDFEDYELEINGNKILLKEPFEVEYELPSSVYFSNVPGNPSEPENLEMAKEGRDVKLTSSFSETEYPTLKLFKPERDKIVMVSSSEGSPTCIENRDTLLVCAESKENKRFREGGMIVERPERVKFALQLRDTIPDMEVEVETETLEEDNDALAEEAAGILGSFLGIPPPVTSILTDLLPGSREAAIQVKAKAPEGSDVSGFEVHCSLNTPVGSVDLGDDTTFVSAENDYLEGLEGDVDEVKENLDYDVSLGEIAWDDPCEYVKLKTDEGLVRFVRKIRGVKDSAGDLLFSVKTCGGSVVEQLSSLTTSYCITIVPVDGNGNRGKPETSCQDLLSMRDRVLEAMGLSEIKDGFMKMKADAENLIDAVQNRDPSALAELSGDSEFGDFVQGLTDNAVFDTLREARRTMSEEDYTGAIKDFVGEDGAAYLDDMMSYKDMPHEWKQRARESMADYADLEGQKEFLGEAVDVFGELRDDTQESLAESFKEATRAFTLPMKIQALRLARRDSPELANVMDSKKVENLNFNSRANLKGLPTRKLNELGLTDFQTHELFEKVMDGEYGIGPQKALMSAIAEIMPGDDLYELYKDFLEQRPDKKLLQTIDEHLSKLPEVSRQEIMHELLEEMPKSVVGVLADGFGPEGRAELFRYLEDNYAVPLREAAKEVTDFWFDEFECGLNPYDNFKIE